MASEILGGEPCPELAPELALIELAHAAVGQDQNGRALHAEVTDWLDENEITDQGMRDAYRRLFRAIEGETSRVRWEQMHERMAEAKDRTG